MKHSTNKHCIKYLLTTGLLFVGLGSVSAAEIVIAPMGSVSATPTSVTQQAINGMQALGANVPSAPAWYKGTIPTTDAATYDAQKQQANAAKAAPMAPRASTQAASLNGPPVPQFINLAGASQATSGGWIPADTNGAAGRTYVCEVTNSHFDCFTKLQATTQWGTTLAALFGYTAASLFDPRVTYDAEWDRWIVTAEGFPEAGTGIQRHFVAVSKTSDPTAGTWWIQSVAPTTAAQFWDYPNIGMDRGAIYITGNVFNAAGTAFLGSRLFRIPKAQLYNGRGWGSPLWNTAAANGTLVPPMAVNTKSRVTVFASAPAPSTSVFTYQMYHGVTDAPVFAAGPTVIVPNAVVPPNAQQPGTVTTIDTLDGRLLGNIYQHDYSIYMMRTIGWAGGATWATAHWVKISIGGGVLQASGSIASTGNSDDFNGTLAVTPAGHVLVGYSSTDRTAVTGYAPQVRIDGKRSWDAGLGGSSLIYQSPFIYDYGTCSAVRGCRWGDYSSVSIDPANTLKAWVINETSES
ncbi:MAG: hypothetical protein Q9M08_00285, partial [Mariprofundus sp.]|nr:hypothetical protein [Mariprofundus sp.]